MATLFIKDAQAAARDRQLTQLAAQPKKKRQAKGFAKLLQALLDAYPNRKQAS